MNFMKLVCSKYQISEYREGATGFSLDAEILHRYLGDIEYYRLMDEITDKGAAILFEFGLSLSLIKRLENS